MRAMAAVRAKAKSHEGLSQPRAKAAARVITVLFSATNSGRNKYPPTANTPPRA